MALTLPGLSCCMLAHQGACAVEELLAELRDAVEDAILHPAVISPLASDKQPFGPDTASSSSPCYLFPSPLSEAVISFP
eukprot:764142-Hanusia_phi.AAC.6